MENRGISKLVLCIVMGLSAFLLPNRVTAQREGDRPNILMITVDDMNWDSPGCFGGSIDGITPNIDKLATRGTRFRHAYVQTAACTPSRISLLTGLYPHNNAAEGFEPIDPKVTTLTEILHDNGYINGVMGKEDHLLPPGKFYWDFYITTRSLGGGRIPKRYYTFTEKFLKKSKEEKKPFFLMANSNDPHRPFAGGEKEVHKAAQGRDINAFSRKIRPDEVVLPPFLPNIKSQREEFAAYLTSVHRADESVGAIMQALDDSGMASNTIVIFLSDHGMSFPFAKETCMPNGTRTPLIISDLRSGGQGVMDTLNVVAGVDLAPTILDFAEIKSKVDMNGLSLVDILKKPNTDRDRDFAFSEFHETGGYNWHPDFVTKPTRAIHSKRYTFIVNFWSNGQRTSKGSWGEEGYFRHYVRDVYLNDSRESLERYYFLMHRVPEEFYDLEKDPDCLDNLIGDPGYTGLIKKYRDKLTAHLKSSNDPAYPFLKKGTPAAYDAFYRYQFKKSKNRKRIDDIMARWPLPQGLSEIN